MSSPFNLLYGDLKPKDAGVNPQSDKGGDGSLKHPLKGTKGDNKEGLHFELSKMSLK